MPRPSTSSGLRTPRLLRLIASAGLATGVAACATPPDPIAGRHPADPAATVPAPAYVSVTTGVQSFRPVEPKGWEELNRQVTPKTP